MTYLATEMLLYLLSAALIGLVLGWLIWGAGRRRKMNALKSDLTATIEMEREAHHATKLSLDEADAKMREAIEAARADANRSLAELRKTVDAERLAAQEAHTALERMRGDMEEALEVGKTSGQEAVDQAMRTANAEKAAAAEAMGKEAQLRAQLEELRLLIGAEKLAAESARSELQAIRANMGAELDAERVAHEKAKIALDDIQSTLARTLGSAALGVTGKDASAPAAAPTSDETRGQQDLGRDRTTDMAGFSAAPNSASPFSMMTDMAAAGEALNNPDLDEADIEDREDMSLDLSSTIDTAPEPELDLEVQDAIEVVDPTPPPVPDRIELRPMPVEPARPERPAIFLDGRPDDPDELMEIDGISPEIKRRLHKSGCYHYRQLAGLTPRDLDWLAREIDVSTYQMAADRWVDQAKALLRKSDVGADQGKAFIGGADRKNAAG